MADIGTDCLLLPFLQSTWDDHYSNVLLLCLHGFGPELVTVYFHVIQTNVLLRPLLFRRREWP